mgnify:CR=1 FL=1
MNALKFCTLSLFILVFGFGFTDTSETSIDSQNKCKILHEGTFKYGGSNDEIKVVIKGTTQTEYHDGGKYIIQSELDWVNDCEYNMTMQKVTVPNFPYGKGAVMNVKVNKVKGNKIFYTSTLQGKSWQGTLIKSK